MDDLNQLAKKTGDAIAVHYVSLDNLEKHFLDNNSKKHDVAKLIESIRRYGFRDPLVFDPNLNDGKGGIVAGNGRLESLIEMRSQNLNLPRGLKEDWLVPVVFGVNSTSEAEAVAFSIEHNWSVLWGSEVSLEEIISMFDAENLQQQLDLLQSESSLPIAVEDNLDELLETFKEIEIPEDNQDIDEEKLKTPNHKCPQCGYRW